MLLNCEWGVVLHAADHTASTRILPDHLRVNPLRVLEVLEQGLPGVELLLARAARNAVDLRPSATLWCGVQPLHQPLWGRPLLAHRRHGAGPHGPRLLRGRLGDPL